jgi:hypothetical protein
MICRKNRDMFVVRRVHGWAWVAMVILTAICIFQALPTSNSNEQASHVAWTDIREKIVLPVPEPTPAEIRRLARKIAEANPQLKSQKLRPGTQVFIPDGYFPQYYVVNEDDIGGYSDIARWRYQMRWNRILNEDGVDVIYLPSQLTCSELK